MRTISRSLALAAAALAVLCAPAAADWSVGSNLSAGVFRADGVSESIVLVQAPNGNPLGSLLVIGGQPGMRFGFSDGDHREEVYFDTGVVLEGGNGGSFTALQVTGNYQYGFSAGGVTQPYATLGLGANLASGGSSTASALTFGGGIGLRQWVAGGHGAVRVEFRVDRTGETKSQGYEVSPATTFVGVKFGVDLWLLGSD
jgi:hypothetical protein